MTIASPWFAPLYLTAFCAAMFAIVRGPRIPPRIRFAVAAYALVAAAFVAGLAVRGMHTDISGEPFMLPPAPAIGAVPHSIGPATGPDPSISVDTIGGRTPGSGADAVVALKLNENVELSGWAYDALEHARCTALAVVSDGKSYAGTYGAERPDVAAALGEDHRFTGFRVIVPASPLGRGTHRIQLRCFGAGGRSYVGPISYTLRVTP